MRNFLDIDLINSSDLNQIIDQAIIRKNKRRGLYNGEVDTDKPLKNLILAAFFIFVLYLSIQFTITAYNKPTAILRIPFSYVDVPVVIFFISIIIRSIQKFLK